MVFFCILTGLCVDLCTLTEPYVHCKLYSTCAVSCPRQNVHLFGFLPELCVYMWHILDAPMCTCIVSWLPLSTPVLYPGCLLGTPECSYVYLWCILVAS